MDNLDTISNEELRLRLLQYGFPNMPITNNTRKLLIKKLRSYMENEKTKLKHKTSSVTRYSSGEDSETEEMANAAAATYNHPSRRNLRSSVTVSPRQSPTERNSISPSGSHTTYTNDVRGGDPVASDLSTNSYRNFSLSSIDHNDLSTSDDFTKRLLQYRNSTVSSEATNAATAAALSNSNNSNHANDNYTYSRYYQPHTKIIQQCYPPLNRPSSSSAYSSLPPPLLSSSPYASTSLSNSRRTYVPINETLSKIFKKIDDQYNIKQSLVPFILVSILILFFAIVIFAYLTISPDIVNNLNPQDTKFKLCQADQNNGCIDVRRMESALSLLKTITPQLQTRAINRKCHDAEISSAMTQSEIVMYITKLIPSRSKQLILDDISDIAYLVDLNAQWQIKSVASTEGGDAYAFEIIKPKIPVLCMLKIKFRNFFLVIGTLAIVSVVGYAIWFVVKKIQHIRNSRKQQINYLIKEVLNAAVELSAKDCGTQDVIILNHLRDKLITSNRKEMEKIWLEAVDYLEQNESRLLFEIRTINGEDCKTIKWVDPSVNMSGNNSTIKKWQSPAFDKTNKIVEPPTPCLKIRQMFEKFEVNDRNLKTVIQNSIIEKVEGECKIYDIQIDTKTCCVYVRCASPRDAGMVHNAVNGWWFDNRLVSIKFVRLERYLSRFPNSYNGPNCLRPTNTQNLSMSNYVPPHLNDEDLNC